MSKKRKTQADIRTEELEKQLKPCPCCKNPTPGLIDLDIRNGILDENDSAEVECGCGVYAWGETVAEAIRRWNTRKRKYEKLSAPLRHLRHKKSRRK